MTDARGRTPDDLLRFLVKSVDDGHGEVGLTLLIGGRWVSGVACPPRQWLELLAAEVDAGVPPPPDGSLGAADIFRQWGQTLCRAQSEVDAHDSDRPPTPPAFIHLRDAHALYADRHIPARGVLIRCRLDDVGAWIFGEVHFQPDP